MTILTSSASFTIGDAATVTEQITISVLPAVGAAVGRGRLVHPALGTYEYARAPDQWTNMDGDAIVAPTWASTRTLGGAANTLWKGSIRDVEVVERWNADGGLSMTVDQLRMLVAHWSNPPDPAVSRVKWYPSYVNANGYEVALVSLTSGGGDGIALNHVIFNEAGYVNFDVELRLRILGKL